MKRVITIALLLSACARQPENRFPDPVGNYEAPPFVDPGNAPADALSPSAYEIQRIERVCVAYSRTHEFYSCDFGTLADAQEWERLYAERIAR